MSGGDWNKWNTLYASREYADAQRKELRRFTGRLTTLEWAGVGVAVAAATVFIVSVAWRILT